MTKTIRSRNLRRNYSIEEKIQFLDLFHLSKNKKDFFRNNKGLINVMKNWLKQEKIIRAHVNKPSKYSIHSGPKAIQLNCENQLIQCIVESNKKGIKLYSKDLIEVILKHNPELKFKNRKFFFGWLYRFYRKNNIIFQEFKKYEKEPTKNFVFKVNNSISNIESNDIEEEDFSIKEKKIINKKFAKTNSEKDYKEKDEKYTEKTRSNIFGVDKLDFRFNIVMTKKEENTYSISFNNKNFSHTDYGSKFNKEFFVKVKMIYIYDFNKNKIFPKFYISNSRIQDELIRIIKLLKNGLILKNELINSMDLDNNEDSLSKTIILMEENPSSSFISSNDNEFYYLNDGCIKEQSARIDIFKKYFSENHINFNYFSSIHNHSNDLENVLKIANIEKLKNFKFLEKKAKKTILYSHMSKDKFIQYFSLKDNLLDDYFDELLFPYDNLLNDDCLNKIYDSCFIKKLNLIKQNIVKNINEKFKDYVENFTFQVKSDVWECNSYVLMYLIKYLNEAIKDFMYL